MKKIFLLSALALCQFAFGQYYYLEYSGGTPGDLNQDGAYPEGSGQVAGWNSIIGPSQTTPIWSADQTIPFTFNFNGSPVTDYKVSSTGVLTFDTGAGTVPGATSAAIPSASIPDNSICLWGLEASGTNDNVSIKTFGSAPNRQLWIHFSSCANGSIAWSYYSIVLEETSDKIYLVDQRNTTGTGALSMGVQINSTTAYSVTGSPNVDAVAGTDATPVDDFYYEFNFGTLPAADVQLTSFDLLPYVGIGNVDIEGSFVNYGADPITALDVTWDDGTGPYTQNLTGLNIPTNGSYNFTHSTPLVAVSGNSYTIDLTLTLTGDANMADNTLQMSTISLTSIPTKVVVGEEKTGTWCGWCPRGAVGLAGMESEPQFIGIAVHNGDPMTITAYDNEIGTYVPGGYPGAGVDRVIDGDPSDFDQMFADRVNEVVPCAVNEITANYNDGTDKIEVSTTVEFFGTVGGDYRISCVVIEDDVIGDGTASWNQTNYYDGGGSGLLTDPITSFEWSTAGDPVDPNDFGGYDHVARYLSSSTMLGDAGSLPSSTVTEGTYDYDFADINASVVDDIFKSHVVVMVVNANTGEILNAGKASIGTSGLTTAENNFNLSVYPNPANDQVNLSFNLANNEKVAYFVTDITGKVIYSVSETELQSGAQKFTIDTNNLTDGVYFINLQIGGKNITKKLVIAK
ncbi:MAG: T9SS type A sorting domain-containing protein [Crocinitomicaceae bacterium]